MPINPCGRGVDFLQASVTDLFRPFRDSDLVVKRRWYRVPEGTPLLGFPSAFLSAHYEAYPWYPRDVGEVFPPIVSYGKWYLPDGLPTGHVCGSQEDFQLGAVFDPNRNVVYDDEWIPECCGRESVCTTQLCAQEQVNDRPAAQLWSYPIPHQEATGSTPVYLFQRALNEGNHTPAFSGTLEAWYPAGTDGDVGWSQQRIADDSGVPVFREETFRRAADEAVSERDDATGRTITVELGGASGTFTLKINGGLLELCGTNAQICPAILPPGVRQRIQAGYTAAGTTQGTATPIITAGANIVASNTSRGVILPSYLPFIPDPIVLSHSTTSPAASLKVYPPVGSAFPTLAVNQAWDLDNGTMALAWPCGFQGPLVLWTIQPLTGLI